jgi:hypothetical protein
VPTFPILWVQAENSVVTFDGVTLAQPGVSDKDILFVFIAVFYALNYKVPPKGNGAASFFFQVLELPEPGRLSKELKRKADEVIRLLAS